MKLSIIALLAVLAFSFVVVGCDPATEDAEAACVCEKGEAGETVWCEECKAGYVDKKKTECADCFAAMKGGPACEKCVKK
jgi:hypothetical protein